MVIQINADVECPDCGGDARAYFSRKGATVTVDCDECQLLDRHAPSYDEQVIIG